MTTKCTGVMGRIFGHRFLVASPIAGLIKFTRLNMSIPLVERPAYFICQRCGAVTGEKK